jgi:hypothetical protein
MQVGDSSRLNGSSTIKESRRFSMLELGYALSSEEIPPSDVVRFAQKAEETGFSFADFA